mgnify:CR=1 FL=1
MTSYPPTTLLPPSPPYKSIDEIIDTLCSRGLDNQMDDSISEIVKQQHFDLTLNIIEFWYIEENRKRIKK